MKTNQSSIKYIVKLNRFTFDFFSHNHWKENITEKKFQNTSSLIKTFYSNKTFYFKRRASIVEWSQTRVSQNLERKVLEIETFKPWEVFILRVQMIYNLSV